MARRIDPQEVYSYLLGKGLTPNHAVGMLNNIQHESAFQPAINEIAPLVPGSRGGYGLFQHTGPRRRALEAFAGDQVADWRKQIDYALTEPDTERYLGQDFSDPGEASQWFTTEWERPANKEQKARQRMRTLGQFAELADMPMPDVRMAADYGAGGSMTTGSTNPMDVAGDPVTGRMMTPLLGDIPSAPTDDYASREMRRMYEQLLGQDEDQPQTMLGVAAGALKQAGEAFNRLPLGYQYTAAGVRPVESSGSLAYKAELARGSKDKTRAQLGLLEAMSREQRGERADARSHADRVYRERKDAADRERQARIDRLNEADAAARSSRAEQEHEWKAEDRLLPPEADQTAVMQNLQAAGLQPGTPEYEQAMLEYVTKPQTQINMGPKLPAGYQWQDPANPSLGVKRIEGMEGTEGQSKAAGFFDRMSNAEKIIGGLEDPGQTGSWFRQMGTKIGPQGAKSAETQMFQNAADDWIRAKLRRESGAVISEEEMASEYRTYFPQPGDSDEVIQQKAQLREVASQAIKRDAGSVLSDDPAEEASGLPEGWSVKQPETTPALPEGWAVKVR